MRSERSGDRSSGRRSGQEDRRFSSDRGFSGRGNRDSDRGGSSRNAWGGSARDRRDDGRWRGSYPSAPRRGFPSYHSGPRYPAHYRYGYFHRHGYYFPRYYYDYESYPTHAAIRVLVDPAEAEVYVDGYYAGVADAFDGLFQRLYLAPGRHQITLRLDGYQTWSAEVYATPDSTLNLHHDMLPGASGPEFENGPGPEQEPGVYEGPGPYQEPERE